MPDPLATLPPVPPHLDTAPVWRMAGDPEPAGPVRRHWEVDLSARPPVMLVDGCINGRAVERVTS